MSSPPLERSAASARPGIAAASTTRSRVYPGKRVLDVGLVVLSAPLWLPILGIVAALVRLKLGSPIFFIQERPGLDGRPFRLVKFRTMTDEREASGALLPDAQRLTPFGRMLRATSLDELPELWNVLEGEMSLVGPRPLLMHYLELYSPRQLRRHEVPPGITGLAQVSGRNAISWRQRLELDVRYVEQCSLGLDLRILWKTVIAVVKREGITGEGEATVKYFQGEQ